MNSPKQSPPASRSSGKLVSSLSAALTRREAKSARRKLTILPKTAIDFSSNDFLSLSQSPVFRGKFLSHVNNAPESFPFASGGSRLLDGNSAYTEELERFVAKFHEAPTALLFNSGYDANVGILSSIPQPGDVILYDEFIHASSHEGMRLSRAGTTKKFPHSCPNGFREVLLRQVSSDPKIADGTRNVLIVIESIYSMDGDIAPIREFVQIVDDLLPCGNGYFIVDEAHATGVLGPRGAGVVQELGIQDRMLIRVHTFGKALACHGAMVLCGPEIRDYLINYARSLIYTTALGFPFLASIRTAYELLSSGEMTKLQDRVQELIGYLRQRLDSLQITQSTVFKVAHFPTSPIISLLTSHPRQLAAACQKEGYIVRAIMSPTVPEGTERVRVCMHAGNTKTEIDGLVQNIQSWLDLNSVQIKSNL
ncbi:8-amino-7-oxononanoate synthase [Penicillium taxi]|uniref:8-amino-7-oxononanoate synthase n=1 Tax=Penicillium taxi TaxID=168475 RepID=UPI0025458477|nr:8-amino-7-oxononanoate synthase [Penicillium taxi]KAJ5887702.1 8-amino-7-oxononanoate synthase [Penicillium taxi]